MGLQIDRSPSFGNLTKFKLLDNKHYPESGPVWKPDGVRFPGLRKALMEDGLLARRASQVYRDGHRNQ